MAQPAHFLLLAFPVVSAQPTKKGKWKADRRGRGRGRGLNGSSGESVGARWVRPWSGRVGGGGGQVGYRTRMTDGSRPLCTLYAPSTRPLCPPMRPRGALYELTALGVHRGRIGGRPVYPPPPGACGKGVAGEGEPRQPPQPLRSTQFPPPGPAPGQRCDTATHPNPHPSALFRGPPSQGTKGTGPWGRAGHGHGTAPHPPTP